MIMQKSLHFASAVSAFVLISLGTCYAGGGGGCTTGGSVSVPEPASLGLLGAGIGAVLLYRWRKSK